MTIEEKSKYSQTLNKDESVRIFNKDKSMPFTEWNYGYCQGYFDAMQEFMLSSIFASRVNEDELEKARPYLTKAIGSSGEERNKAIEELKKILKDK